MGVASGPNNGIIDNGLVFYMDAANTDSYPRSGTNIENLIVSNTASLNNGTFITSNAGAFNFDGTGDYIDIESPIGHSMISPGNSTTINIWFRTDPWVANGFLFEQSGSGGNVNSMFYDGYDSIHTTITVEGDYVSVSTPNYTVTQEWIYYTLTMDPTGPTFKTYLNGVNKTGPTTYSTSSAGSDQINYLGRRTYNSSYMLNGQISNYTIYNRVLSDDEILQNYKALKQRFTPNLTDYI